MSRNGSGVYSLPAGNPVVTGTTISSSWANTTLSDIATALTGSVASDGQTPMTGNLQMGSNKVTGLAVATSTGDALSYGQAATVTDLSVTGNATVGGTLTLTGGLTLNGNVTVGDSSSDTLTVNATSTFAASATFSSTFAANGGVTLGDASGDALTINSSAVSIPNGLNFDSNTLVIDATNNRVGVGVASPTVAFQVGTGLLFNGSTLRTTVADSPYIGLFNGATKGVRLGADSTGGSIEGVDNTGSASYQPLFVGGSDLRFTTSGSERMRITSAGNVGIGTSSPSQKLTVAGGSSFCVLGTTGQYALRLPPDTSGASAFWIKNDAELFVVGTGGNPYSGATNRLILDSSGNLGLGTTPSAWNTATKNIQLPSGTVYSINTTDIGVVQNAFLDSTGTWKYVTTAAASYLAQAGGAFTWASVGSGTAGATAGFTEKMKLDSSGNLGLGVTPSASWSGATVFQTTGGAAVFNVTGTNNTRVANNALWNGTGWRYIGTDYASMTLQASGTHYWYTAASGTAGNAISFTQAMTLDASGNLSVGTTSNPSGYRLKVNGITQIEGANTVLNLGQLSSTATYIQSLTTSSAAADLVFLNSAERMKIDSSGYLKQSTGGGYFGPTATRNEFKQTAADTTLAVYNNAGSMASDHLFLQVDRNTTNNTFYALSYYNGGAGAYKFRVADSGNVTNTNNSYGAISDVKLKENIVDATPKLADLCDVKVRNFNFIGSEEKQLGVIAQELETVFPSMVEEAPDKDADGNDLGTVTKQVKYSVFVPMLIKAIQEQQAIITDLKARIETLESK